MIHTADALKCLIKKRCCLFCHWLLALEQLFRSRAKMFYNRAVLLYCCRTPSSLEFFEVVAPLSRLAWPLKPTHCCALPPPPYYNINNVSLNYLSCACRGARGWDSRTLTLPRAPPLFFCAGRFKAVSQKRYYSQHIIYWGVC